MVGNSADETWDTAHTIDVQHSHEGSCLEKLRQQLAGANSDNGPHGGLYSRAMWHLQTKGVYDEEKDMRYRPASMKRKAFESASTIAWLKTLSELTREQKRSRKLAMTVVTAGLVLLTGTASVERWLGELSLQEMKRRAHKVNMYSLQSAIKLNLQDQAGRRVGMSFDPLSLLKLPFVPGPNQQPSVYGKEVREAYKVMYGEKKLPGRSSAEASASDRLRETKPKLSRVVPAAGDEVVTIRSTLGKHAKAVTDAVNASATQASWQPLLDATTAVAAARADAKRGVPLPDNPAKRVRTEYEDKKKDNTRYRLKV